MKVLVLAHYLWGCGAYAPQCMVAHRACTQLVCTKSGAHFEAELPLPDADGCPKPLLYGP